MNIEIKESKGDLEQIFLFYERGSNGKYRIEKFQKLEDMSTLVLIFDNNTNALVKNFSIYPFTTLNEIVNELTEFMNTQEENND